MVTRGQRRIRSKTVRNLLSFAHHRFRNFLKHKASENGRTVLIVNEAYTSKTVSWTGEINHKLGGRKTVSPPTDGGWTGTTTARVGYSCALWEIPPP